MLYKHVKTTHVINNSIIAISMRYLQPNMLYHEDQSIHVKNTYKYTNVCTVQGNVAIMKSLWTLPEL